MIIIKTYEHDINGISKVLKKIIDNKIKNILLSNLNSFYLLKALPFNSIDNLIIINADQVLLTGKKTKNKIYYRHTGYPGGIKETNPDKMKANNQSNKIIKLGICGEHGGDPKSIDFCARTGLDYVSCSPYRVPVARLAAAQAQLKKSPF